MCRSNLFFFERNLTDFLMLTKQKNNIDLFDGQHLTSKSKLCQLHFAESDIIKEKTVKNGIDIFILLAHWRLKTSAVPICVRSQTNNSIRAVKEPTCVFLSLSGSSPTTDVNEQQSPQSSQGKVYLFNYFDIIDELSTIFTGMRNNSRSAGFAQYG